MWPSRELGRFDLAGLWAGLPADDGYVYACGPEQLLTGLEDSARAAGPRGAARGRAVRRPADRRTSRTGRSRWRSPAAATVVTVGEDDTVLDAVNRAGAAVLSTCREGTCGTCEVRVLDGVPRAPRLGARPGGAAGRTRR